MCPLEFSFIIPRSRVNAKDDTKNHCRMSMSKRLRMSAYAQLVLNINQSD